MTKQNPDDSVREEQFDNKEENIENFEHDDTSTKNEESTETVETEEIASESEARIEEVIPEPEPETEPEEVISEPETEPEEVIPEPETEPEEVVSEPEAEPEEVVSDQADEASEDETLTEPDDETDVDLQINPDDLEELPEVDYSGKQKHELVETLELLIENRPPAEIRDDVEKIKVFFYKKHKVDNEKLRLKFVEEGGSLEDFRAPDDPLELKIRSLLSKYRGRRTEYSKQLEVEKQENLRKKYEIIENIKDLVNREESINKTFQEFRDLQTSWHSIGLVPQSAVKDLWETYNHNVEIFYDYIKINKELRDLDFKKNLEKKIRLCERAEELLIEPNPVNAFRKLQEYHQSWREIGPVPRESRNEVWERFREITSTINRKHHEYFEGQKDDQRKNLDAKIALCEKIEEMNQMAISSFKEWEDKAKEVIEIQKVWRTIGFAPKKQNNAIYQRFREACDSFFQNKRNYYSENKDQQMDNLQKKTDLCIAAESMQDSTDWKETTDALIKLQKEWKEIGAVPRKFSDKIWKRFRKACDHFFNKKSEHFSELDSSFDDNLKRKEEIILKLEKFEPGENPKDAFNRLNLLQKEWAEIGFVPFKSKDDIAKRYRSALNKQFDSLKIDDEQKAIIKYKTKLEGLRENPKTTRKIRSERDKFIVRIKQLEGDIVLWENNIGFFSKSKNADALIKEVHDKIENAKNTIQILEEKVRMIDSSGLDE